jgi:hypothetical protein
MDEAGSDGMTDEPGHDPAVWTLGPAAVSFASVLGILQVQTLDSQLRSAVMAFAIPIPTLLLAYLLIEFSEDAGEGHI